jgi:hypothetical protein
LLSSLLLLHGSRSLTKSHVPTPLHVSIVYLFDEPNAIPARVPHATCVNSLNTRRCNPSRVPSVAVADGTQGGDGRRRRTLPLDRPRRRSEPGERIHKCSARNLHTSVRRRTRVARLHVTSEERINKSCRRGPSLSSSYRAGAMVRSAKCR